MISKMMVCVCLLGELAGFGLFIDCARVQTAGNDWEGKLYDQYSTSQIQRGLFLEGFYDSVHMPESIKMDDVLMDAMNGRYGGTISTARGKDSFYSAVKDVYPQMGRAEHERIAQQAMLIRDAYKQPRTELRNMLQGFDAWRTTNSFQGLLIHLMSFPDDYLVADVAWNMRLHGPDAEEAMWMMVTASNSPEDH